jgi:leucyl/phenylalanyl-tRNA--protein transferase
MIVSFDARERIPPEELLNLYASGLFPMGEPAHGPDDIPLLTYWRPRERGVLPIGAGFRVSKNLSRLVRNGPFRASVNLAFEQVMVGCSARAETWITDAIFDSYVPLHTLGYAHSIEIWGEDMLVGGLYGVSLGRVFFGESMFKLGMDADKVALVYCNQLLHSLGYALWDTQFWTQHLAQFGCRALPRKHYEQRLATLIDGPTCFAPAGFLPKWQGDNLPFELGTPICRGQSWSDRRIGTSDC